MDVNITDSTPDTVPLELYEAAPISLAETYDLLEVYKQVVAREKRRKIEEEEAAKKQAIIDRAEREKKKKERLLHMTLNEHIEYINHALTSKSFVGYDGEPNEDPLRFFYKPGNISDEIVNVISSKYTAAGWRTWCKKYNDEWSICIDSPESYYTKEYYNSIVGRTYYI